MPQPGLMMELPLLLSGVLQHAETQFGRVEVVSRETHGPLFRYTYADCAKRARQLANALAGLGLKVGHGDAHLQPTPASGSARLHHQPRRRPCGLV